MSKLVSFQERVDPWMRACFGPEISKDRVERNHRFLEESVELVQSLGCTESEAHQLVSYVFARPVGEPHQEAGGVMVTLAALCLAADLNMHEAGNDELERVWGKIEKIRAKQAAKPKHSPLPEDAKIPSPSQASIDVLAERGRQVTIEGWTPDHDDGHDHGELIAAAIAYQTNAQVYMECLATGQFDVEYLERKAVTCPAPSGWPWEDHWWKPKRPRRDLVRGAALLIAEIERIDRVDAILSRLA